MLSPVSPVSSRPASNKTQTAKSPNPIRKPASVDQVHFSGPPQEPAKAPGWFKKYGWPTVGIVTGSTIAALGIPLHIIPVVGNAVGLGMNIVGGMIALFGVYKAYQAMNSNKSTASSGRGTTNNNSQQTSQQSNGHKGRNSGGLGGNGFLGNMATGAALGIGSSATSEAIHAGVDHFKNRNDDDNEDANNHGSDAGSEAGDDASIDGDSDFGSDFDVDV